MRQWFFEVLNEPNLTVSGTGKQEDYFALYRYTVEAIKSIDSGLKVAGPATADNAWTDEFLPFCKSNDLPADFISTHHEYRETRYPRPNFIGLGLSYIPQRLCRAKRQKLFEKLIDAIGSQLNPLVRNCDRRGIARCRKPRTARKSALPVICYLRGGEVRARFCRTRQRAPQRIPCHSCRLRDGPCADE